ncbi:class I SAM-dependent methyltransferase [Streptomyces sp. RFCAC02]|uniref:class I SAM-dependent methyltransferase n=1 Tax=Streptomyces sp. RFCAC02 TaxID=2499143 RepID=UPI0010228EFB|nr:class I SAM-dependent methyltransferase [Streptomyces sp. RFCAC02]
MDERGAAIAAYWGRAAARFDEEPDHGLRDDRVRRAWAARLARWVPASAGDVLDAGCGTGSLSVLLAGAGHRVTGVDLAPAMVAAAREKAGRAGLAERTEFLTGDAAGPPVGGRRFGAVLARHLLWTLPDPHAALRAWCALTRPGGRLVLVEGRWRQPAGARPYVPEAAGLPWGDGVGAETLTDVLRPWAETICVEPLADDPDLWGGPVDDERYALVATLPEDGGSL